MSSLYVLTVLGLSLPFVHYYAGWLMLIAPLPLIFLLNKIRGLSSRTQIFIIWSIGFFAMAIILFWILQTQPERWTGFEGLWAIVLLIVAWLMMVLSLSAGWWLFGFIWVHLGLDVRSRSARLGLPALWVICEYLRAYIFSLVSWGQGTTLGPFWGLGVVGNAVGVTPLGFASRLVGFYGLGVLVVLINLALYKLITDRKDKKTPILVICGAVVIALLGYLIYLPSKNNTLKVASVQLGVDPDLYTPGTDYYDNFHYKQDASNSDILVAPEYSQFFEAQDTQNDSKQLLKENLQPNGVALTSMTEDANDKHYNRLVVYSQDGSVIDSQRKEFLIPVGESNPYILTIPLRLLGKGSEIDTLAKSREVSKGDKPIHLTRANGYNIGALVCSGAVAPFQYQELVKEGADILTNSASLSIFGKADMYHQQTQQIARTLAIATNRPFVQSTDGSYSYIIDKDGSYLAKSSQDQLEIISARVSAGKDRTIYDFWGEWVLIISGGILLMLGYHKSKIMLSTPKNKRKK